MSTLREDAFTIIEKAIEESLPDQAVKEALTKLPEVKGKIKLLAIGKAAWQMSKTASDFLGDRIDKGICITKYNHSKGHIRNIEVYEAGHPVVDENAITATRKAEQMVSDSDPNDLVIVLISGGGSALFEDPCVDLATLQNITGQLLSCGADIREINTIRKRLSFVKGGKFALQCMPARVFTVILSDIIHDPLDMIASGPCYKDTSTCLDALQIVDKYRLEISDEVSRLLNIETPKDLTNVTTYVSGSVTKLCKSACNYAEKLGYKPVFLTSSLQCEAKEAGSFLASIACDHSDTDQNLAFISGGETVVHIHGKGKGGRNQELAIQAAACIEGMNNCCIFSVGSDGTDGPTDAAGGYVDGNTAIRLKSLGISIDEVLENNDSYHALQSCNGLIKTEPTGTNVNDLSVILIRRKQNQNSL